MAKELGFKSCILAWRNKAKDLQACLLKTAAANGYLLSPFVLSAYKKAIFQTFVILWLTDKTFAQFST